MIKGEKKNETSPILGGYVLDGAWGMTTLRTVFYIELVLIYIVISIYLNDKFISTFQKNFKNPQS